MLRPGRLLVRPVLSLAALELRELEGYCKTHEESEEEEELHVGSGRQVVVLDQLVTECDLGKNREEK